VPFYQAKNKVVFYSISDVRDLIFRRNGRKRYSKQLSPFLLPEIIAFQKKFQAAEEAIVPTDAAFEEDAELAKKLAWMMRQKSPEREVILADFMSKIELARQVFQTLESA